MGEAIAETFGLGEATGFDGPVARGELGEVWRLDTASGRWAVKRPFGEVSATAVEADVAYQEAAAAAGVLMPRPIRTVHGDVTAASDLGTVRVYEWVDVRLPDRLIDPLALGATLAAVHRVRHDGATPIDPWYSAPVGADAWGELIGDLQDSGAPFADPMAAIRDELVALERLLEPPARLRTCHRDLVADNVRDTAAGTVCVIDWENSGLADIDHELAFALFEFGAEDLARCAAIYEAYRGAGGPARVERPGHFTMAIAVLGHLAELSCRRWLDPDRRAERDHHAARIDEFLADPLRPATIEAILATLGRWRR